MNNLKRTLALVATLALAATAFVGCGDDETSSTASKADTTSKSDTESKEDDKTESKEEDAKAELTVPDTGDVMSILGWNATEVGGMIDVFVKNNKGGYTAEQIKYVEQGTSGGEAAQKYATYFSSGDDCDLFIAEADWILTYINNDEYSAPLSNLGITEADFADAYAYTVSIAKDNNGVLKGASWQAAAGGYCYRTDLAKDYLGVTTPEEMQAKVDDWDKFMESAATVAEASSGKTAMTATIGGMWQVYSYNRDQAWVVDNKLTIDDSCTEFMNICKDMKDKGYVTSAQQWAEDGSWYAIGQDDSTLGYFFSTWCLVDDAMLQNASGGKDGKTYGKWNICVGPTEYCWGGSWLCLSPNADNGSIAQSFVKFYTTDADTMKIYATEKNEFVNNKKAMKEIVDSGEHKNALLGGQDQFAVLMDAAAGIDLEGKITKDDSTIKANYIEAVNGYVDGTYATVEDALKAFEEATAGDLPDLAW
ncbi:MAG: carbohydrate ABC transporter substrate-binding protein [Ruminococcus sp.]|nr:carbohydrate ABC transporter substrate-binding protein [Ruminococcus sp.]